MPRKPLCRSSLPYHVVSRANNREAFGLPLGEVWKLFTDGCYGISTLYGAQIHAFVLMPNHYHMILSAPVHDLGETMSEFGGSLTRTFNRKSGRLGHLFAGPYKWSLIDTPLYFSHAVKYVYRNPVKAGLVSKVEDYEFSSLFGLLGKAYLPFPMHGIGDCYGGRSLVPEDLRSLVDWINTPYREGHQDLIRSALRRKIFSLPRDPKTNFASILETELS